MNFKISNVLFKKEETVMSFGHKVLESKSESEYRVTARENLNAIKDNLSNVITDCSLSFLEWKHNIAAQKSLELAEIVNLLEVLDGKASITDRITRSMLLTVLSHDNKKQDYPIINALIEMGLGKDHFAKVNLVMSEAIKNIYDNRENPRVIHPPGGLRIVLS
jgi:hypothetical protein